MNDLIAWCIHHQILLLFKLLENVDEEWGKKGESLVD